MLDRRVCKIVHKDSRSCVDGPSTFRDPFTTKPESAIFPSQFPRPIPKVPSNANDQMKMPLMRPCSITPSQCLAAECVVLTSL
jgi:hypothetical protein